MTSIEKEKKKQLTNIWDYKIKTKRGKLNVKLMKIMKLRIPVSSCCVCVGVCVWVCVCVCGGGGGGGEEGDTNTGQSDFKLC